MNPALLTLLLANFAAIGALPLFFFRRDGRLNLAWLATAIPFFLMVGTLLAAAIGWLHAVNAPDVAMQAALESSAALASAASLGLLGLTVGSHRVPLALWHQERQRDVPSGIVTWGPYSRIRHPFYSSFLLAFAAACFAFPHVATAMLLFYAAVALTVTAMREERRLASSVFGAHYRDYMARTGRFVPRLGAWAHG